MKTAIVLAVFLLGVLAIACSDDNVAGDARVRGKPLPPTNIGKCTDSDVNYGNVNAQSFYKGFADLLASGQTVTSTDFCSVASGNSGSRIPTTACDSLNDASCSVHEYQCTTAKDDSFVTIVKCTKGCYDGACKK